ncbi:hypothetical protein PFTANZ_04726 [Plasmodium falciparum Tanzania (2000708)]|uniref:Uncharacterized protein n=1 Tax=Plasmodium falciparum Tanzania (2000708) TaxID=1036725 RepID=A0A024W1T6_PLAFA|nr:hypothetical protein PFTANZ_04726 [Plasmodium falciparum Tanzania (2000708)]
MKQKKKKNTTQEKKKKKQNEKAENKIEDIKNKEDDEITTEINKYNKQKINMIEQNKDDAKKNLNTYQNNESNSIIKNKKNIKDKQIGCKQNTSYNICTTNNINNEIHKYPQKQYNHIYTNQSNISHNIHNTYYSQNAYQNENYYYQYLNYPHVANFNMMMNTTNPVLYNNNNNNNNIYDKSKKNNFNNLGFSKNKEMNIDINKIPVVDQREILREWKPNIIKEEKKSQKYTIKTKVYNPVNNTFDKAIIHGKNQKRKHQINWLAKEAVEKEYEILQKTNNNKRRTTSDKYGW